MAVEAIPQHPVLRCLRRLSEALDEVADVDPLFLSTADKREALLEATALQDRLSALRLSLVAVAGDVADADGMPNVASWLTPRIGSDAGPNHRDERFARSLRTRWHQVAEAFAAGAITRPQADIVVHSLEALGGDLDQDLVDECERNLVALCATMSPRALRRSGRKILELVAPERYDDEERKKLEREERRAEAQARLSVRKRRDGTVDVQARISEAAAQRLMTYLHAWTSPRHNNGPDPVVPLRDPATGEKVPHDQRLGLAFMAFLEGADPARMPIHGGTVTTIVLTMSLDDLRRDAGVATLGDGTTLSATEVRRLACNANLVPAVLGGKGEVLDLGLAERLFSAAQRRAMEIEHPTCRAQGCEVPAAWCEAHHWTTDWCKGGRTDLRDGKLLCPYHHHRAHDGRYLVKHLPDGGVRFNRRT